LSSQKNITVNYQTIPDANHSFSTKLDDLTIALDDYLGSISLDRLLSAPAPVAAAG